uniref:Tetraspanin-19 n=1 Tax=Lactuca sativa TaxID=4236 RepID=A0A9R1XK05_LACSA|nr:hypothetical protein LSAT_V11C300118090 [Lactuca sativa]
MGMYGIATIFYAVWIIKIRHHQVDDSYPLAPWYYTFHIRHLYSVNLLFLTKCRFIYAIFGFGAILCAITLWGHIAAEMSNIWCLYCYLIFIFLILILEGAITMDVILNPNWEKDFPKDPSGNLIELKDFIKENIHFCKWVGLSILSVEGFCMFLATILIALGPHQKDYESDNECTQEGVPFLKHYSKHVDMRPLQSSILGSFEA